MAYEDDPNCGDMILLGMKPTTTEEQIREYFSDKCDLAMVQMKKSKDGNSGYAFIKFSNKEEERTIMRQHHQIDGRECRSTTYYFSSDDVCEQFTLAGLRFLTAGHSKANVGSVRCTWDTTMSLSLRSVFPPVFQILLYV